VCPKCDGDGRQISDEDPEYGEPIWDACYHCGTEGFITEEQWQEDRFMALVGTLANAAVERERTLRDQNPDGEDCAFCAAENTLDIRTYTEHRCADHEIRLERELRKLDPYVYAAVLDTLVPDNQMTEEQYRLVQGQKPEDVPDQPDYAAEVVNEARNPPPRDYSDDEIPF